MQYTTGSTIARAIVAACAITLFVMPSRPWDELTTFGLLAGQLVVATGIVVATWARVRLPGWRVYTAVVLGGSMLSAGAVVASHGAPVAWGLFAAFLSLTYALMPAEGAHDADVMVFGNAKVHPNAPKFLGILVGCGGYALAMYALGAWPVLLSEVAVCCLAIAALMELRAGPWYRIARIVPVLLLLALLVWRQYPSPGGAGLPALILLTQGEWGFLRVGVVD